MVKVSQVKNIRLTSIPAIIIVRESNKYMATDHAE